MSSTISQSMLNNLLDEAAGNPRLRKNLNFHPSDDAVCHRLLNALQPGTYVLPHRHLDPNKTESMILLRGKMGVLFFDEQGVVTERFTLTAGEETFGINIDFGTYHSVVALTPCVFFEAKAGPYVPIAEAELAPWAPRDGAMAAEYLAWMQVQFA